MRPWWQDGVLYQIYPRSFQDSNGDGVGDLAGVIERLDHLEWLGIDGVWLNPVTPSPNADWGYDVSDYCDVDPELGTLEDLDRLVAEAARRGIRVVLDLVPNHTSDRHPWFVESRSSRESAKRGWYVWADPKPDGSPPNNWLSIFGGPGWTLDRPTGQYYLHGFLAEQPDLDWWSDEVRAELDRILRFWFDRGVAGFRIDVAHRVITDRELRDNPGATADDPEHVREHGQRSTYTANQREVHEVYRRWRQLAEEYDPARLLLGEVYVLDPRELAPYFGVDDELQLAFNFAFVHAELDAAELSSVTTVTEEALGAVGAWPVVTGSNHDAGRLASRWCDGDERKVRCALLMLLTLRGTPVLYYGDEIGMPEVDVPRERVLDPVGLRRWPRRGRDPGRTPMQWADAPGAGFTTAPERAWLPTGDASAFNVAAQREDPASVLHLCRDLLALRRRTESLRSASYAQIETPPGAWAWRRGDGLAVALNLSDEPVELEEPRGMVLIGTDRSYDGEPFAGRLDAWEGIVVATSQPSKNA